MSTTLTILFFHVTHTRIIITSHYLFLFISFLSSIFLYSNISSPTQLDLSLLQDVWCYMGKNHFVINISYYLIPFILFMMLLYIFFFFPLSIPFSTSLLCNLFEIYFSTPISHINEKLGIIIFLISSKYHVNLYKPYTWHPLRQG